MGIHQNQLSKSSSLGDIMLQAICSMTLKLTFKIKITFSPILIVWGSCQNQLPTIREII